MKDLGATKNILGIKYTNTEEMLSLGFHKKSMLKITHNGIKFNGFGRTKNERGCKIVSRFK